MLTQVILPKVDMDMASAKIAKWHVKNGDTVKKGAPLFEIETDKAAMEIEAPADGVISGLAAEGADIPVGDVVALISGEGETEVKPKIEIGIRATPLARRMARESEIDLSAIKGSGPQGRIVSADLPRTVPVAKPPPPRPALPQTTAPQFTMTVTCDLANVTALSGRADIALEVFFIKALAMALQRSGSASDVATQTHVIRAAESKQLSTIKRELSPPASEGPATAILYDLRHLGIEQFSASVTPPQICALAIGESRDKSAIICTLSADPRAMDIAAAGGLLAAFRAMVEEPALMLA